MKMGLSRHAGFVKKILIIQENKLIQNQTAKDVSFHKTWDCIKISLLWKALRT